VFIRQVLSEGEVRHATVQSTADGPLERIFLRSKDQPALHPEDESRMMSVQIRAAQTPGYPQDALIDPLLPAA
jgi:hypothetical protein